MGSTNSYIYICIYTHIYVYKVYIYIYINFLFLCIGIVIPCHIIFFSSSVAGEAQVPPLNQGSDFMSETDNVVCSLAAPHLQPRSTGPGISRRKDRVKYLTFLGYLLDEPWCATCLADSRHSYQESLREGIL